VHANISDIKPTKILVKMRNIESWTDDEVYDRRGDPIAGPYMDNADQARAAGMPKYSTCEASFRRYDLVDITETVCLIDYCSSFFRDSPDCIGVTPDYAATEVLLKETKSTDVWALACTIFEIRFTRLEHMYGTLLSTWKRTLGHEFRNCSCECSCRTSERTVT